MLNDGVCIKQLNIVVLGLGLPFEQPFVNDWFCCSILSNWYVWQNKAVALTVFGNIDLSVIIKCKTMLKVKC